MRFPLPRNTFPVMKFSSDQTHEFADTRNRILDSCMDSRQEFIERFGGKMDTDVWKVAKRKKRTSDFTVYRPRRFSNIARPSSSISCSPLMVGLGSIPGTLDEVMLGMTASNTSAMRFRAAHVHNDMLDMRVLSTLEAPSQVDPFEYMGVKWMVKGPSFAMKSFVRPRDFIYLESSGIRSDYRGQRVGHLLLHSVELSCCRSLQLEHGIVRGALSFCYLFAESETMPGMVDVFVKGFVDPRGGVSERIAVSSAAGSIMACERAQLCARMKKLSWKARNSSAEVRASESRGLHTGGCHSCDSESTTVQCRICRLETCSKCATSAMLTIASVDTAMTQPIDVCCSCLESVEALDSSIVAGDEAAQLMGLYRRFSAPPANDPASGSCQDKIRLMPIVKKRRSASVIASSAGSTTGYVVL
ncbi:TPA: hypothetical protein N0F65_004338 [Lagenidium giganteum]|uniref:Uncharacterized protein n=1 Tax=Lagenidium giganteum TaxID=4803 RepID=A0AAV2YL85_9STRA|nr:TPA: hypothetical protein N0F65_004338 [Lagenidium giganteum]